ncbi:MAG: sugar phosphate nucleotidyltransferase [Kofleriaceae bacterium]
MRHAVILAGGSGTRLWPASRRTRPKQFVPLGTDGGTLLAAAITRGALVADEIVIVTAASLVAATREAIAALPLTMKIEILAEPEGRNTAAAIGLAAAVIAVRDPDALLVVLPADQRIANVQGFAHVVRIALAEVAASDAIATIGIVPTRPDTGFGYLEVASTTPDAVTPVLRFVEKPDFATAERYVTAKTYLWNAGMFLVSARRLLAELEVHVPITGAAVQAIAAGRVRAEDVYPTLPSISIDHGVMERATRVITIPAAIGWDDVGSWAALAELELDGDADADRNVRRGRTVAIDAHGNYLASDDDTVIAAVGVDDLVIVKVGNAILVIPKSRSQDVRKVIDELASRDYGDEHL